MVRTADDKHLNCLFSVQKSHFSTTTKMYFLIQKQDGLVSITVSSSNDILMHKQDLPSTPKPI